MTKPTVIAIVFFAGGFGCMFIVWIAALVYFGFNLNALADFVTPPWWQDLGIFFTSGLILSTVVGAMRG